MQAGERVEILEKHIRQAQRILADYIDPRNKQRDPEKTIEALLGILKHKELVYAQRNRAMPRITAAPV